MSSTKIITNAFHLPWQRYDHSLLLAASVLLLLGLVMVGSASIHRIESMPFYFVKRHLISMVLGAIGFYLTLKIPLKVWEQLSPWLYLVGLVLLVLVLIPGVGNKVNGAQRWIPIGGFSLQSSEFMKLFMMLYLAGYLKRRQTEVATNLSGFLKPMLPLLLAAVLIMLEPDMGTTVVLLATAFAMLFLGGVAMSHFLVLMASAGSAVMVMIMLTPWRKDRVTSFLDPFADPLDTGYQLSNALIALGRGEWFGVGLGQSIQKLHYLPEAHNDFLLSIIGEELGFVAVVLIILLFSFIILKAFRLGIALEKSGACFSAFVAYGCGLWIGFQSFVNIAVNLGLIPTKGLTLPLMSYGGNSIIVSMLIIGLLQRSAYELKSTAVKTRGGASWRQS